MKVMEISSEPGKYLFWCPACECCHWFKTIPPAPQWTFNGDIDKPTVRASILVRHVKYPSGTEWPTDKEIDSIMGGENVPINKITCHLFITDGKIEYLGDCSHSYAGKTIEMEDIPC